jgi:hypothetical protein
VPVTVAGELFTQTVAPDGLTVPVTETLDVVTLDPVVETGAETVGVVEGVESDTTK